MINYLAEMFSYTFLIRAVVVGILVSLCASLLGVTLVLKRYSMIGDGLSHVSFGAMAVASAFNITPLYVAIPIVVTAAFLLLRISENSNIKGDSAIALISSCALAAGVIIVSKSAGMSVDLYNYMFGSILSIGTQDTILSIILCIIVLILYILFYNRIFSVTFNESFAKATGVNVSGFNILIAVLTAVTVVLGMRMMGALLISSLIIFPPLCAMNIFKKFRSVVISSGIISAICFFMGILISYIYETPTGASVVIVNSLVFLISYTIKKIRY